MGQNNVMHNPIRTYTLTEVNACVWLLPTVLHYADIPYWIWLRIFLEETSLEDAEASRFAAEDALDLIGELASDVQAKDEGKNNFKYEKGLGMYFFVTRKIL